MTSGTDCWWPNFGVTVLRVGEDFLLALSPSWVCPQWGQERTLTPVACTGDIPTSAPSFSNSVNGDELRVRGVTGDLSASSLLRGDSGGITKWAGRLASFELEQTASICSLWHQPQGDNTSSHGTWSTERSKEELGFFMDSCSLPMKFFGEAWSSNTSSSLTELVVDTRRSFLIPEINTRVQVPILEIAYEHIISIL